MQMQFIRTNLIDEVSIKRNGNEIAYFVVYRSCPWSMSIHVEEEQRGAGLSRRMMNFMLEEWVSRGEYDPFRGLYIDTDASGGFWEHIGMTANPEMENKSVSHYGYEKVITVADLDHYLNFKKK